MNTKGLHKILDIQDAAKQDAEYMRIYAEYAPAQERFAAFCNSLPEGKRKIVDDYLFTSVQLYHRILEIAVTQK